MALKLVLSCKPTAAILTPKHRTREPTSIICTVLRAIMPCQMAPTVGDILAMLFEANESSLLAEMGLLVPE